jgi:DNA-3-methyladenine glycosylase
MQARRQVKTESRLCSGPGKLTQALGVGPEHNATSLLAPPFAILGRDPEWREVKVETDLRVGITKGTELPWRYCAAESRYLSVPLSARA